MRKLLFIFVVILSFATAKAQNPFAEYGYTPKIATLSQGQFNEFFDNDTLVQIGSVLFNTKSKQIVAFIETDTLYSEATLEPDLVSRWISPDPLTYKYPSWSPYNYTMNNPVNMIDPDGRDAVYIAFPKYRANGIPFTGHAGVLLIDNKTGVTKYYEYGRYDKEGKGLVRTIAVSNVVIGKDEKPTSESLNKVMKQLSDKSGHGSDIEGAYVISDKFKEMNDYAKGKIAENSDPKRKEYFITGNNCATFAEDVITQDKSVDEPGSIINSPVNIVSEYQEEGNAQVQYKAKTQTTTIGKGNEEDAKVKEKK